MDLFETIQRLMDELTASIKVLRKNGEALAEAERDYKITLTTEALKMRADDTPVTLINATVYGLKEVADKRFARDVAQATYEANREHINAVKLRLRILDGQLQREFGTSGKGDL